MSAWVEVHGRRWVRSDGAVVKWDANTPHSNPEVATALMWTAWESEPSQRYLGHANGRVRWLRLWRTPEAAMAAVDELFPIAGVGLARASVG
jgi:hypothetical protein